MYEVELKVRASHDPVRERLSALDATTLGVVHQADTYYDAPHRSFADTDEALRLRRETTADDHTAILTYKGPLVETASKTREERETAVADAAAMEGILDALGFTPAAAVEKDRERFSRGAYTVALDAVAGLGEYVEVERTVEEDIEAAREGASDLLRDLGCDPTEQVRTSYLGLLIERRESDEGEE